MEQQSDRLHSVTSSFLAATAPVRHSHVVPNQPWNVSGPSRHPRRSFRPSPPAQYQYHPPYHHHHWHTLIDHYFDDDDDDYYDDYPSKVVVVDDVADATCGDSGGC